MESVYELRVCRVSGGGYKTVEWTGRDGLDACRRFVDCHRDMVVTAWRVPPVAVVEFSHHSAILGPGE